MINGFQKVTEDLGKIIVRNDGYIKMKNSYKKKQIKKENINWKCSLCQYINIDQYYECKMCFRVNPKAYIMDDDDNDNDDEQKDNLNDENNDKL